MPATGPWLCLTDPGDIQRVFTADTDVRAMSRAHVVEYVTRLIWAALSGLLGEAGIVLVPADRPRLTLHRTGQARGKTAG